MARKLLLSLVLVFLISQYALAWAVDKSLAPWAGEYEYQASLGSTVGGDSILVDMKLTVGDRGSCEFIQQGYQTNDDIICQISPTRNGIKILFVSFSTGEVAYPSGVVVYRPGDTLFSLFNANGHVLTRWGKIKPKGSKQVGRYFD
jgi:hypothetical protein